METSQIINEYLSHLQESVPWRSGKVPVIIGKTSIDNLYQDCIILNNLHYLFTFKPSFMLIMPDINQLKTPGSGTNGQMIIASEAQELEFDTKEEGKCLAKTYFFGRAKSGRTLDFLARIFEKGFSLSKFEGLKIFGNDAVIDITGRKKAMYTKHGKHMRKVPMVKVRIKRVK